MSKTDGHLEGYLIRQILRPSRLWQIPAVNRDLAWPDEQLDGL